MSRKVLRPLEVGQIYVVPGFESFEFAATALTGEKPMLRLHLVNKTILELQTSDDRLQALLKMLNAAYPNVLKA